ncbi:MAG: TolC family protein [Bdellovibrionales bacterium]|nr:TolC family protein [Bdellovibrionales bacterium]
MKPFFFSIFISLFFCKSLNASELTLSQFLKRAQTHDPEYQILAKEKEKIVTTIDEGLPNSGVTLAVDAEKGLGDPAQSGGSSILTGSLSKDIVTTGTSLKVSHTDTSRPDRDEDVTEVRIEQDLFKNLLGRDTRLKKVALQETSKALYLELDEKTEDYLQKVISVYLDFKKAQLDTQLAESALKATIRLENNIRARFRRSVATKTDIDKAHLQVLLRQEELIEKKRTLSTYIEDIRKVTQLAETNLNASTTDSTLQKIYQKFNSHKFETEQARLYLAYEIRESVAEKEALLADRELHPELNLIAGYDIDQSRRFSSTVSRSEAILGLNLQFPISDSVSQALRKKAILERAQAQLDKKLALEKVAQSRNNATQSVLSSEKLTALTEKKVLIAKRVYEDETKRYNFGKLDLDILINLEKNLLNYQYQHQSEKIQYSKAIIEWLNVHDLLLEQSTNM